MVILYDPKRNKNFKKVIGEGRMTYKYDFKARGGWGWMVVYFVTLHARGRGGRTRFCSGWSWGRHTRWVGLYYYSLHNGSLLQYYIYYSLLLNSYQPRFLRWWSWGRQSFFKIYFKLHHQTQAICIWQYTRWVYLYVIHNYLHITRPPIHSPPLLWLIIVYPLHNQFTTVCNKSRSNANHRSSNYITHKTNCTQFKSWIHILTVLQITTKHTCNANQPH